MLIIIEVFLVFYIFYCWYDSIHHSCDEEIAEDLGIIRNWEHKRKVEEFRDRSIPISIILIVIIFIAILVIASSCTNIETYEELTNTTSIVSFDEQENEYVCKYQISDNEYDSFKIDIENTKIIEEKQCYNPHVCEYTLYKKYTRNYLSCFFIFCKHEEENNEGTRYELYIPKCTIRKLS